MPKVPAAAKPVLQPPAAAQTGGRGTAFEKAYAAVKEKSPDMAATLVAAELACQTPPPTGDPTDDKLAEMRRQYALDVTDTALASQLLVLQSRQAAVEAIAELAANKTIGDKLVADLNVSGRLGA
jgi:hypothetical protein